MKSEMAGPRLPQGSRRVCVVMVSLAAATLLGENPSFLPVRDLSASASRRGLALLGSCYKELIITFPAKKGMHAFLIMVTL